MRYAKQKSTGQLIESQGGGNPDNPAHLQTLKDNAISSGIAENDIEVGYEDDAVVAGWIKTQDESALTYADMRKAEYPSIEELVVALYDTDDKAAIEKRRSDVKAKYPKPE
jgi:hypothetical protein